MFYQLLFIHLFRPFLKYKQAASPLPAHVSPRKFITHSATTISKLLRLYRRTYGLRQICNIAVYIVHTACTVHLLNLPDKSAQRDIHHGLNHLEEMAEGWLCARRTLHILHHVARRWKIELPEACMKTFVRVEGKFGSIRTPEPDFELKAEDPFQPEMQSIPQQNGTTQAQSLPSYTQHHLNLFPPGEQLHPSPMSTPDLPTRPHDNLTLPPQSPSDLSRLSRSQHYVLPQTHTQPPQSHLSQTSWQSQHPRTSASSQNQGVTSPTQLFGGVQKLIQDQDWWLRDSNQLFMNWNADPQDESSGAPSISGINGYGRSGAKRSHEETDGYLGNLDWNTYDYGSGSGMAPNANDNAGGRQGNFDAGMNRYGELDGF